MYYVCIYIYITVPIIIGLPYVFIFYKASSYVMLMINESPGAECMAESCPWVAAGDIFYSDWWWAKKQDSHGVILIAIILIDIE